jgi:hypothetical protein
MTGGPGVAVREREREREGEDGPAVLFGPERRLGCGGELGLRAEREGGRGLGFSSFFSKLFQTLNSFQT